MRTSSPIVPGWDPPGDAAPESSLRRIGIREVVDAVDEVPDPCSESMGRPIGLVEMAILRRVEVVGRSLSLGLCLTEPTCLYAFQIAESVQEHLHTVFGDDVEVKVEFVAEPGGGWWTEEHLSPAARVRLAEARRLDRLAIAGRDPHPEAPRQSTDPAV